jgi:glycosyltransferase involved in cell wall biosynthesis
MAQPKISVIIPTYNSERTIEKCLISIVSQNYPNLEVLIVDNGSRDRTISICKKFSVKIIESKQNIVGLSRQIGVEESTGDICAFIDSDVILPSKTWLSQMETHFYDKTPHAIAGVFSLGLSDESQPAPIRLMITTDSRRDPPKVVSSDNYFPVGTGHTMILKSVILKLGGFKRDLHYGDDLELTDRVLAAGYCFIYDGTLKSYHLYAENWLALLKKMLRNYRIEAAQGYPKNASASPRILLSDFIVIPSMSKAIQGFKRDKDQVWFLFPVAHFLRAIILLFYKQSNV